MPRIISDIRKEDIVLMFKYFKRVHAQHHNIIPDTGLLIPIQTISGVRLYMFFLSQYSLKSENCFSCQSSLEGGTLADEFYRSCFECSSFGCLKRRAEVSISLYGLKADVQENIGEARHLIIYIL